MNRMLTYAWAAMCYAGKEKRMDFRSGKELLEVCEREGLSIARVMVLREMALRGITEKEVEADMAKAFAIMRRSVHEPLEKEPESMGGLIGGEAKKLDTRYREGKSLCGSIMTRAITYAMAVLEVNASMGVIVAAPTAGSAGEIGRAHV